MLNHIVFSWLISDLFACGRNLFMIHMAVKHATPATYAAPAKMMRPVYEPPLVCKICPAIGTPVSALWMMLANVFQLPWIK